ncbi:drug/metabolite transporter (DMT)-like permease [Rhizobium sp. BK275]|nr:drug/metabolite transporter (DMT)-like permease [Rhizobium sp. BK275]
MRARDDPSASRKSFFSNDSSACIEALVAIGVVFLGETLSSTAGLGLACVMAGVIAMTLPARTRVRQAA